MFGTNFYNESLKRYVAVFGTLFNDIQITKKDNSSNTIQTMPVPLSYGPRQKFLNRIEQDPNLNQPEIRLPRMSFEIDGIEYDPTRKLTPARTIASPSATDPNSYNAVFNPAPYNLNFTLSIMVKYVEDGNQIVEQILPYFKPDFTPVVKIINDPPVDVNVPIILNSVTSEDTYEGNYEERRFIIWTLKFTMKAYFYGPSVPKKVIKFVQANIIDNTLGGNTVIADVKVQPGLTSANTPTTSLANTIPYTDINYTDNWDYIVVIE